MTDTAFPGWVPLARLSDGTPYMWVPADRAVTKEALNVAKIAHIWTEALRRKETSK